MRVSGRKLHPWQQRGKFSPMINPLFDPLVTTRAHQRSALDGGNVPCMHLGADGEICREVARRGVGYGRRCERHYFAARIALAARNRRLGLCRCGRAPMGGLTCRGKPWRSCQRCSVCGFCGCCSAREYRIQAQGARVLRGVARAIAELRAARQAERRAESGRFEPIERRRPCPLPNRATSRPARRRHAPRGFPGSDSAIRPARASAARQATLRPRVR